MHTNSSTKPPRQFSVFENWPAWLFNTPLIIWCILLGIRYRSITLPTITNPRLPLSGLCGESKAELYELLGSTGRTYFAPFVAFTTSVEKDTTDIDRAEQAMQSINLTYPVVAKPDIGRNGTGVQIIRNRTDLVRYLSLFPRGVTLLLQHFVPFEGEAGVFYIRPPGAKRGQITSLTLKFFPKVEGDGIRTVAQLILDDPRAKKLANVYFPRLAHRLQDIPRKGEIVHLVSVGNHVKGSLFEDGAAHITPALEEKFKIISEEIPEFRLGRFDVRYASLDSFKEGKDFMIIEYNGVSSEPTHIFDRTTSLKKAYRDYFSVLTLAFAIGNEYRRHGWHPASLSSVYKVYKKEVGLLTQYPPGQE